MRFERIVEICGKVKPRNLEKPQVLLQPESS